ncbi:unnamed protein product [Malus baccata var. baccata]
MLLWDIWKQRNDMVWNGFSIPSQEVVLRVEGWLHEFQKWHKRAAKKASREVQQWQKPKIGWVKCNFDGAWSRNDLRGMGWVARDFTGVLQTAGASREMYCHSALAAEAVAIRQALEVCGDNGFDNVIVQSDAKVIIQMIRRELMHDYSLECILGDIEIIAQRLRSVTFVFVSRECNRVAHSVAKYVFKERRSLRSFVWDCIGPDFLFNILAQDIKLSIQL